MFLAAAASLALLVSVNTSQAQWRHHRGDWHGGGWYGGYPAYYNYYGPRYSYYPGYYSYGFYPTYPSYYYSGPSFGLYIR